MLPRDAFQDSLLPAKADTAALEKTSEKEPQVLVFGCGSTGNSWGGEVLPNNKITDGNLGTAPTLFAIVVIFPILSFQRPLCSISSPCSHPSIIVLTAGLDFQITGLCVDCPHNYTGFMTQKEQCSGWLSEVGVTGDPWGAKSLSSLS